MFYFLHSNFIQNFTIRLLKTHLDAIQINPINNSYNIISALFIPRRRGCGDRRVPAVQTQATSDQAMPRLPVHISQKLYFVILRISSILKALGCRFYIL